MSGRPLFDGLVSDVEHRDYVGFPGAGRSVTLPAGGFLSHLEIVWGNVEGEATLHDAYGSDIPLSREGDNYFPLVDYTGAGFRRELLANTDARCQYRLALTARADVHVVWREVAAPAVTA